MANKITKKEMFNIINNAIPTDFSREVIVGDEKITLNRDDLELFIKKEISALEKKSTSKSKAQKAKDEENEKIQEVIKEILAVNDKPTSVKEINTDERLKDFSNQKITSQLTKLKSANIVVRTEEKGVALYELSEN